MFAISNRAALFAVTLISLLSLTVLSAKADAARSFTTGLVDMDAFEHGSNQAFNRASNSGAKIIKNNLYWGWVVTERDSASRPGTEEAPFDSTDPASPYYRWNTYDNIVRMAAARNMEVAFSIVNTPRWARIGACPESGSCSPKPAAYADFAKAAAARYSGSFDPGDGNGVLPRVRFWQAWVEPNFADFYQPMLRPNGSPRAPYLYRSLLNAFYDAVHSVDNSNFVIAGGLAPNGKKNRSIAPLDFTRRALCMTGNFKNPRPQKGCNFKVKADAWAVHPYTTGGPNHLPANGNNMSVAALPRMQKLLNRATNSKRLTANKGRTQLWVTEFSWDSRPPDPKGLPWNLQARWVAEAMHLMYKANVNTMLWFGLRDQPKGDGPWSWTFQSGLYLRGATIAQDKPKKVLQVFRYPYYAQLAGKKGFRFWGRTPNSKRATIDIFGRRKGGGGFNRVGTVKANVNGIFQGMIRKRGFTLKGASYAKIRGGKRTIAFGLWKTKDRYQPPFG